MFSKFIALFSLLVLLGGAESKLHKRIQYCQSIPQDACENCINVVGAIEYQIMTHESLIEQVLNVTLCRSQECSNFVAEYLPILIKMLNAELSAPVVCTDLGWCKKEFNTLLY
jgi:hypothetical protein